MARTRLLPTVSGKPLPDGYAYDRTLLGLIGERLSGLGIRYGNLEQKVQQELVHSFGRVLANRFHLGYAAIVQRWVQEKYGKPVAFCNGRVMMDSDGYICINCEWYWSIADVSHYKIMEEFESLRVYNSKPKREGPPLDKQGNPRTGRPAESAWSRYDDFKLEELEEWNPTSV